MVVKFIFLEVLIINEMKERLKVGCGIMGLFKYLRKYLLKPYFTHSLLKIYIYIFHFNEITKKCKLYKEIEKLQQKK